MIQKGIPHANKKTFVCRVANDGYKLKKNNRIKQDGSLLPLILDAFESKKNIPEICWFRFCILTLRVLAEQLKNPKGQDS